MKQFRSFRPAVEQKRPLVRRLLEMLGLAAVQDGPRGAVNYSVPSEQELVTMAQLARFVRDRRAKFIPAGAWGEPAWEALLVLYTQRHANRMMTAEELANSTSASPPTASRWIDYLEGEGMIERKGDIWKASLKAPRQKQSAVTNAAALIR